MKKPLLAFAILLGLGMSVCAQLDKVALISVWGDKNLSDDPMETKIYEKLLNDPSYNLSKIISQFDALMQSDIVPMFPFPFLTKAEVTGAAGYPELRQLSFTERTAGRTWYIEPAESYVPLASFGVVMQDDEAIKKSFELYEGVDGVMIAYINFNMVDAGGVGPYMAKAVRANCNIKIFNRDGKRIFKLQEYAKSDKKISSVGGIVTEPSKVVPLIQEACDNLFADVKKTLPKKLEKMVKKIDKLKED